MKENRNADRMILGENAVFSTDSLVTGLNNNVIVCGTSGCGKTMSIAEPRLLETFNSSMIITLTKKRLAKKYREEFRRRGYDVLDLDFANPGESTAAFDPLHYVNSYEDITFLAKTIVESDGGTRGMENDSFWENAAESLLSAEIAYILMTKENATLNDVLDFHDHLQIINKGTESIATSLDEKFRQLEKFHPNCFAVRCWNSFSQMPPRTARCVYGTLNSSIDTMFTPEIRASIRSMESLDFERLGKRKTVVFVTTSPVNKAMQSFINMFYGQAFKDLFEYAESLPSGVLPIPVHILCDDFATGGRVMNFADYISIFREKRISVTLLIQSESQLVGMYGESDATTIINNCDSYVYMGSMDVRTAHSVGLKLDVPTSDVFRIRPGTEAIFRRGEDPIITSRYHIQEDEAWRRITEEYERSQEDLELA